MQIGYTEISSEEHLWHRYERLCFYCGQSGHQCAACPDKPKSAKVPKSQMSKETSSVSFHQSFTLPIAIDYNDLLNCVTALVDSEVNLIHHELVTALNIPTISCIPFINITTGGNKPIGTSITKQTIPPNSTHWSVPLRKYFVICDILSPKNQIILGHLWLTIHDPHISWEQGDLIKWLNYCQLHCFKSEITLPCLSTIIESPDVQVST